MIIVGVGHKSEQGKDKFCDFILTELRLKTRGKRIVKMGFADQLKQTFHSLYHWTGIKSPDEYETNRELRKEIIPYFGTDIVTQWIKFGNHCRAYDEPIWINALLKGAKADVLLLKDVRFPNEIKAIYEHGGDAYKIVRPGFAGRDSDSDNALNNWEDWTEVIDNDQGLAKLNTKATEIADRILKRAKW